MNSALSPTPSSKARRGRATALRPARNQRKTFGLEHTREFLDKLLGDDIHAKRVLSLANGVAGILSGAVLSIHAIGQAYARLADIEPKSGIKQLDRLLSNKGIDLDVMMPLWIEFVIAARTSLVVALDWTDFDDDDHTTLCAYLITKHGRATPLAWKTYKKSELEGHRTGWEHDLVETMHRWIPPNVNVTLLADRGFGDQKLYSLLGLLGWDYVIRYRGNILTESNSGEVRPGAAWAPSTGRPRMLKNARVTGDRFQVPAVVVVHAPKMKEEWCLATSLSDRRASEIVKEYGRRFRIEETFRDTKDLHFGRGLKANHIRRADRRDRLLFLFAIAHALLTLLGAAAEEAGLDRILKSSTVKKRTHSLFRQGTYWYSCLPTMRDAWFIPLVTAFDRIVLEHPVFREVFGAI